jgi:hypothetical protein
MSPPISTGWRALPSGRSTIPRAGSVLPLKLRNGFDRFAVASAHVAPSVKGSSTERQEEPTTNLMLICRPGLPRNTWFGAAENARTRSKESMTCIARCGRRFWADIQNVGSGLTKH